mmetsp:Transcript_65060/g.178531  ORF Transcript_65060/g.178531 Transcript_65060/m.178531 type:complete len:274 (+) Transcript_65060:1079-1900(+)
MHILASLMSLAICGCAMSLSTTMPRTRRVSSSLPPTLPSILMRSRLTSLRSRSATASTASTAISDMARCARLTIFEPSVVIATCTSDSRSWYSKVSAIEPRCSTAIEAARSKPSATRIGWMPRSRRASALSSSAPASTTTPVVPSPISSSCDLDSSTRSLPIWLSTRICSRMVAPSFVMVTSPSGLWSILSMPGRGKKTSQANKRARVKEGRGRAFRGLALGRSPAAAGRSGCALCAPAILPPPQRTGTNGAPLTRRVAWQEGLAPGHTLGPQ